MAYFALMKLPADLKDVSAFRFSKEQIETNKLWNIEGTSYYIHTYENPSHTIVHHNRRRKDLIDLQHIRLSNEQMKKIFMHFIQKAELTLVDLPDEDTYFEEIQKSLSKILVQKIWQGNYTKEDIEKAIKEYEYITEEEGLEPHSFRITRNTPYGKLDFTFYSTSVITTHRHFVRLSTGEVDINKVLKDEILSIFKEICEVLGYATSVSYVPIALIEEKKVLHPLSKADEVIEKLFASSSEEIKNQLGISEEEWKLIERGIRKYTALVKNKMIYEHEYEVIMKDLKKE